MIAMHWPESDIGAVVEPESGSFGLFARYLQPLTPPKTLHALAVDPPASFPEQCRNTPIAITAVLAGQFDHIGDQ
jgi:hypothetical protein